MRAIGPTPVIAAVVVALCAPAAARAERSEPGAACPERGDALVVAGTTLIACQAGKAVAAYPVALGRAGVGKTRAGDGKTPRGRYPLGAARTSARYHRFIPIGYPTPAQRRRGLTGSAIGIHGPPRALRNVGSILAAVGWTQGCVAVATDPQIDEIAAWVAAHPSAFIDLR